MPTTFTKRNKEKLRQEKQREMAQKRDERKLAQKNRPPAVDGYDPDLEGIVPGPQPVIEEG